MERIASLDVHLPPGFRFHPTDEELIIHYLRKKVTSIPLPASIMAEVDLYTYNPWELPNKALFGEDEWYFFTPRNRKYPNGVRPNRAAASGYWKATGTDKPILTSGGTKSIGVKKALVFYKGRPLKGTKTDWIMHEYRLLDTMIWSSKRKGTMRLDDWVLCRVRRKINSPGSTWEDRNEPNYDYPAGFLSTENHPWSTNMNPDAEMVREYISCNEYPMLPYILASQNLPSIESDSSISFQSSNKSCSSVYEGSSNEHAMQFSDPSPLEGLLDQLNRNPVGGSECDAFLPAKDKKLCKSSDEKEEVIISTSTHGNELNFYETDQSEGNNYSPDQWISNVQSQELNHLDFYPK